MDLNFEKPKKEYLADLLDDFSTGDHETDYPYSSLLMQEAAKLIRQLQTPPAQEDAPVCSTCNDTRIVKGTIVRAGQPPKEEYMDCIQCRPTVKEDQSVASLYISRFRGHLENTQFDYYGDLPDGTYKLYTRPADDKLRKAAEEAIADWKKDILSGDGVVLKLIEALEGNPTPSNIDKPYPD